MFYKLKLKSGFEGTKVDVRRFFLSFTKTNIIPMHSLQTKYLKTICTYCLKIIISAALRTYCLINCAKLYISCFLLKFRWKKCAKWTKLNLCNIVSKIYTHGMIMVEFFNYTFVLWNSFRM